MIETFVASDSYILDNIDCFHIARGIKFWANYHDKADVEIISNQE